MKILATASSPQAVLAFVLLASLAAPALSQPYAVSWHTVDGGGHNAILGGIYALKGTVGQPDASGPLVGVPFSVSGGFWVGSIGGLPALSISDVVISEGNAGVTNAVFTVTLSEQSAQTVSVSVVTSDLSANAGADYTATGPTILTFNPTVTSQVFSVPILGDLAAESDETLLVTLSSPVNAAILDDTGTVTITNDDAAPPSRVFVAAEGADLNVCSNQLTPCRNLTAAISQVAQDGEVIVLSPGEYDASSSSILIGKGVKITSPSGTVAFIRRSVVVNALGGRVVLRGLTLKGNGTGTGVTLVSASSLSVEETTFDSWSNGLDLGSGGTSFVSISNAVLTNNGVGLRVGGGSKVVAMDGVRLEGNGTGLLVLGGAVAVRESAFVGHTGAAVSASGGTVEIHRSELLANGAGVTTSGTGTARIGRSLVFGNATGLSSIGGGTLQSRGTNVIRGNGTNASGTIGTIPEQ